MINKLNEKIRAIDTIIDGFKNVIEKCNYIVTNKQTDNRQAVFYTISSNENNVAIVECNVLEPMQVTKEMAEALKDFKACDNHGLIEWEVMDKKTFYEKRKEVYVSIRNLI